MCCVFFHMVVTLCLNEFYFHCLQVFFLDLLTIQLCLAQASCYETKSRSPNFNGESLAHVSIHVMLTSLFNRLWSQMTEN